MDLLIKKTKQSIKVEHEDKILQLIKRAEMFLCFITKRSVKYLVLHNVLYFFEAALILNTLLKRSRKDSEMSFENYFTSNSNDFEKQIEEVRKLYATSKIGIVRNKIIAHKDNKNIGDPLFHFMNRINKKLIDDASEIISKLLEITSKNFRDSECNNEMKSFFADSHNFAIEAIIKEIN